MKEYLDSQSANNPDKTIDAGTNANDLMIRSVTLRVFYYLEATAPNAIADANIWFDTFEKDNPGVKIDRENLFDEPFHDKLRTYAAAGNLPDVMYVWPSGRSDYLHDQRLLKDLTPFINRANLRSYYLPMTMDPSQQQAGYLGMIPQSITTTHVMFVNNEVLRDCGLQPAKTYAELKAQVPVLAAKGYETVIMANKDTWVMQSCLFSMVAGRFCGAGWETKIHSGQAKFTDPDFVAALDFIRQLFADKVIAQSSFGLDYYDSPAAFAKNKGAYLIDGDWRVGAFITDSSTGQALISQSKQNNITIGVFPDIPGAKINSSSSVILGVGYGMSSAIPSGSAKEDAAWKLIKWMTGKEVSQLRTEHGWTPTPSRTDLNFASMQLEPLQKAIGAVGSTFNTATCVIDVVFDSDIWRPINDGLRGIGLGSKTPQQVAADTQRAFDRWIRN
jgi:raffinose/stachyose/melibiose transport system substrate-binding protein